MRKGLFIAMAFVFLFASACEKDSTLNEPDGVTFTNVKGDSLSGYRLEDNIADYDEILGYDSAQHVFLLDEKAGKRIRNKDYPVTPTPFAIAVNGKLIYVANFIPGYSSVSCRECISVEPYSYDNKYRIKLGYPDSLIFPGVDSRNDPKIIARLKKDDKLVDL